ncbi:MAG: hypothetical protein WBF17_09915 [Phycisphaerae bacterium]
MMAAMLLLGVLTSTGAAPTEATHRPAAMKWVDFNRPAIPRNRAGALYPSQYEGEGGRAKVSLGVKPENSRRFSQISLPLLAEDGRPLAK